MIPNIGPEGTKRKTFKVRHLFFSLTLILENMAIELAKKLAISGP
jgi:hypothetical protein